MVRLEGVNENGYIEIENCGREGLKIEIGNDIEDFVLVVDREKFKKILGDLI